MRDLIINKAAAVAGILSLAACGGVSEQIDGIIGTDIADRCDAYVKVARIVDLLGVVPSQGEPYFAIVRQAVEAGCLNAD